MWSTTVDGQSPRLSTPEPRDIAEDTFLRPFRATHGGTLLAKVDTTMATTQMQKPTKFRALTSGVPVLVRDYDEQDEEPSAACVRGAAVRHFHAETEPWPGRPKGEAAHVEIRAVGATHRGMQRTSNEDAFLVMREESVYVVADGMGGPAGGAIASERAVDAIAAAFRDDTAARRPLAHAHVPRIAAELVESIGAANEAIHEVASKNGHLSEMGTTVVLARFDANNGRLYVGHVGDSRCYRLRDGALEQLTRDHTMSEHGVSGREGAYLSRAVGP